VGVKVATSSEQVTAPATGVAPGPVTIKFVAGDVRVVQFNVALNVAESTSWMGTPVDPLTGMVDTTASGGAMVVNVQE
jgi:hypothetical protein